MRTKSDERLIEKLQADIKWWKGKAIAVSKGTSGVKWSDFENQIHLPDHGSIFFRVREEESISVRMQDDGLHVHYNGSRSLRIKPEASNSVILQGGNE